MHRESSTKFILLDVKFLGFVRECHRRRQGFFQPVIREAPRETYGRFASSGANAATNTSVFTLRKPSVSPALPGVGRASRVDDKTHSRSQM